MIPLILRTTEEVVLLVPNGYREAALALGVSRWKTIVHIVMKTASKGIITGILLALARVGTKDDQEPILNALGKLPLADAPEDLQLDALRLLEVTIIRQGRPVTDSVEEISKRLSAAYPAKSYALNRSPGLAVKYGVPEAAVAPLMGGVRARYRPGLFMKPPPIVTAYRSLWNQVRS